MISINITTTSSRTGLCSATVWSLINQKKNPDKIILWLSKEPYLSDDGIQEIPSWVHELNKLKDIIEVKFVKNTGPYRKIMNALTDADPDDILIYADDDVIYGELWLETLLNAFHKNEGKVAIAARVRLTKKNILGRMQSYSRYDICLENKVLEKNYIITGVGGCVLTKGMITDSLLKNKEYISIAPKTDDVWISKIIELSKTKIETCPAAILHVQEIQHNNNALSTQNTYQNKKNHITLKLLSRTNKLLMSYLGLQNTNNDLSIKKVESYFKKSKDN